MNPLARYLRTLAKLRFRVLGLATIKDIPTDTFNRLMGQLLETGWEKASEYQGIDAWIDYGQVRLQRAGVRLTLEWDNWTEGSIEGPRDVVEDLGQKFSLPVTHEWRWSAYDRR
jgi:hypothetical protein